MRYLLPFLACLFLLSTQSCKKNQSGVSYNISGLHDVTVRQYVDTIVEIDYSVSFQSDLTEMLIVEATDLPDGVTAIITPSPDSIVSTTNKSANTCTGKLFLHAHTPSAGTYSFNLSTRTLSSPQRKTPCKLTVLPNAPYLFSLSVSDISIPKYFGGTVRVPISANYVSGNKNEWVTITPAPPLIVTVSPATTKGIPDFTGQFDFHVFGTEIGTTIPVTINASSSQNAVTSSFNIHITAPPLDCAPLLSGTYDLSDDGVLGPRTATVSAVGTNQIEIDFDNYNVIRASIDVSTGQLTSYYTSVSTPSYTITGKSGNFTSSTITVNYTYKEGGGASLTGQGLLTLKKKI